MEGVRVASRSSLCYTSFRHAIKALSGLIGDKARVKEFLDGFRGNKDEANRMIEKQMERLQKELDKIIVDQKSTITTDEALLRAKDAVKRKMIDIHSTLTAANNITIKADARTKGITNQKGVENATKSILQDTYDGMDSAERQFYEIMQNVIDNLETSGKQTNPKVLALSRKLLFEHMAGGDGLKDYLAAQGINDWRKAVFNSRKQDTHKDPVLNTIATAFNQTDSTNVPRIKNRAPYFDADQDYKMPMYAAVDKLRTIGKEKFMKESFLRDVLNWDKLIKKNAKDSDIEKWLEEYFDEFSRPPSTAVGGYIDNTGIYGRKKLVFKKEAGWEAEYRFLQEYGADDFDPIIDTVNHMKKLNTDAVVYNRHGADVDFNMTILSDHLKQHSAVKDKAQIDTVIREHSYFLQNKGETSKTEATIMNVSSALRGLASVSLVTRGAIRDIALDQTLIGATTKRLLTGEGSVLIDWLKNITQISRRVIWKGKDFNNFVNTLENMGWSMKISQYQLFQGLQRDFNLSVKGDPKTGKIATGVDRFGEGVNSMNMANRTHSAAKAFHVSNAIMDVTKIIDGKRAGKGMQQVLDGFGFGEAELAVLKKVRRNKLSDPFRSKDLDLIDVTSILRIKDADMAKIMRPLESAADARKRLYYDTIQLIQQVSDFYSARPSLKGARFRAGHKDAGTKAAMNSLFQFDNIASSQWYNLMQSMLAGAGLNPNRVGGHWQLNTLIALKHNPIMMTQYLVNATAAGLTGLWAWDIATGHEPRNLDGETIADAIQFSGAGGVLNTMYSQVRYNDGDIGLAVAAIPKEMGNFIMAIISGDERRIQNATIRLSNVTPGLNIWWARAGKDYLMQEQMGMLETRRKRKRRLEKGRKRYWE